MGIWLRTGTASFTNGSATVSFAGGADLIAANIRIGDALHAPDGRVYEIETISSATGATITPAYLGTTASGQSYAIQPTRGIAQSLFSSVQSLITSIQGHLSGILSGLHAAGTAAAPSIAKSGDTNTGFFWPAADQIAAATAGVRRWLLSSAAFQVDVPVTGTAVQQSATDTTAGRLARADYAYGPGNLLGDVSQSGGVPTGAVIERGSNANGDFVKFADGTMVCTIKTLEISAASSVVCSAIWTFPEAFSEPPSYVNIVLSLASSDWTDSTLRDNVSTVGTFSTPFSTQANIGYYSSSGSVTVTVSNCRAIALGRWY